MMAHQGERERDIAVVMFVIGLLIGVTITLCWLIVMEAL